VISFSDTRYLPHTLSLHPGWCRQGSVIRFTARLDGEYKIKARFDAFALKPSTTDVNIFANGKEIFGDFINLEGRGSSAVFEGIVDIKSGENIDFIVGAGTDTQYSDTTGIEVQIIAPDGEVCDAVKDFAWDSNPNGVWSYGFTPANDSYNCSRFTLYNSMRTAEENYLQMEKYAFPPYRDIHPYQISPHTQEVLSFLRIFPTVAADAGIFVSEYGVGSAMNLSRLMLHYESADATESVDAQMYSNWLNTFMDVWYKWDMERIFPTPQRYFETCIERMAYQRQLGIDAIRSNPDVIGYSLTGGPDHGFSGEGIITKFRELKPGTTDALFECFAPIRICSFANPLNMYSDGIVTLESVLVNEDVLAPGTYPVRVQVVSEDNTRIFDKTYDITIDSYEVGSEPSFVIPIFKEELSLNGCKSGKYTLIADLLAGGTATGGKIEFYVYDPIKPNKAKRDIVIYSDDGEFSDWLSAKGYNIVDFVSRRKDISNTIIVTDPPQKQI
jgi:hypothetical protein